MTQKHLKQWAQQRDQVERIKWPGRITLFAIGAVTVLLAALELRPHYIVGIVVFGIAMFVLRSWVAALYRCPACKKEIREADPACCPHCGVALKPIESDPA
ncbi:MAG: hypothetical protein AAGA29_08585 [Planctomycetota bacterium]